LREIELSKNSRNKKIKWNYCPRCGEKLPETPKEIILCPSCGLDFKSFQLPPSQKKMGAPSIQSVHKKKLADNEIINNTREFWRPKASIFWPLISLVIMGQILGIILILIIFLGLISLSSLNFIVSPLFLTISSLTELVFMVVPVLYVGQYLQNSTLKNRFKFLGFYAKREDKFFVLKETLLGIGFAIVSVIIVNLLSLLLELIFGPLLSISKIFPAQTPNSDVELLGSSTNIFEIILLSIIMIIIIGPSEEIAFRGFMQRGLVRNYNKRIGIWITAIIFSLIHIVTPLFDIAISPLSSIISFIILLIPYLSISLLLGYLFYWRNENLIAPAITHGLYNALTVIMAYIFNNLPLLMFSIFFIVIVVISLISFFSYYFIKKQ
jgi:membrane protease YdiL (CAAX protease family)